MPIGVPHVNTTTQMKTNILTNKPLAILILLAGLVFKTYGQNLPSLLTEKNINATFSILAYDEKAQEWGIAVATNNIYVGNSTIYIEPGVGAFSVIAETEPLYAYNGLKALKMGKSIQEAIEQTKQNDKEHFLRQVSGIDATGNVYAFTGSALKYWQGNSNHKLGYRFVVMGNQLANNVLETMHRTFIATQGTLAERLLKSLIAGQQSGGQVQGKQSAALVVKGTHNEWFNNIDLRVDNAREPFNELQKLLNYHYGRIRLNQAVYAIRSQNHVGRLEWHIQQNSDGTPATWRRKRGHCLYQKGIGRKPGLERKPTCLLPATNKPGNKRSY